MRYRLSFLFSLAAIISLYSCTDEPGTVVTGTESDYISFYVVNGWADTDSAGSRSAGSPAETVGQVCAFEGLNGSDSLFLIIEERGMEDNPRSRTILRPGYFFTNISVSAFRYKAGEWDGSQTPDFISNMKLSHVDNGWQHNETYMWPGAAFGLRFFGVSPYGAGTLSSPDTPGYPTLDFTVPQDVAEQRSLLTYFTDEIPGNDKKPVQLNLNHVTASIYLMEADGLVPGTIKSISLKNFYTTGTYDFKTGSWTNLRDNITYTQTLNKAVTGMNGEEITDYLSAFTILPQQMQDNSALEIVYTDKYEGVERVFTAPLKGKFEGGKRYNLYISPQSYRCEYIMQWDGQDIPLEGSGEKPRYIDFDIVESTVIKTYKARFLTKIITTGAPDKNIALTETDDWVKTYYKYNPSTNQYDIPVRQADTFISYFQKYSSQSTEETAAYRIEPKSPASGELNSNYTAILKEANVKGSATKPYNLANSSGEETVENTANCYVINAPGVYSLPLVYGNAIKNGVFNEQSVKNSSTSNTAKMIYPYAVAARKLTATTYEVINVTTPYICDLTPSGVSAPDYINGIKILWQDAPDLVSNVRLSDDRRSLVFDVNQSTICQGNAVISVTYNDVPLWSWHIWVTHQNISDNYITIVNSDKKNYDIMPCYLGWVDKGEGSDTSIFRVVFEIKGTKRRYELYFRQKARKILYGYSPRWQFGRPTPFMPWVDSHKSTTKPTYNVSDDLSKISDKLQKIGWFICNPDVLHPATGSFPNSINIWNWTKNTITSTAASGITDNPVVKTIYDPCPVGYSIPAGKTFSGLTDNRYLSSSSTLASTDIYSSGFEIYCDPFTKDPDNTMLIPDNGIMYVFSVTNVTVTQNQGTNISMLTCDLFTTSAGSQSRPLGFTGSSTYPSQLYDNYVYAVWPMREQ